MRGWVKVLPWFVVQRLARRFCEVFTIHEQEYVQPFKDGPLLSRHPAEATRASAMRRNGIRRGQ